MPSVSSLIWILISLGVVLFASLDVGLGAQAYLGIGAVATMLVLYVVQPRGWLRFALLSFALFVSLRYIIWRYTETLPPVETLGFAIGMLLLLAETHGFTMHALGLFTNAKPRERKASPLPDAPERLPTVDVFIPTYNEPVELVRQTVIAATQLDYPQHKLRVHVLDDGGTQARIWANPQNGERAEALKDLCRITGATYRSRPDNADAKAGNVNTALRATAGDLLLILDCDHIPTADFLQQTVGFFLDRPDLAFVQTPHFFRNPDPIERNLDTFAWMPGENEMFYSQTLKGMDQWNAAFFCGSAALISRQALEAVGGISTNSITEDADTALNMHAAGFDSVYLDRPMVAGVQPDTLAAFVQQRTRWAQGMLQILLLNNPLAKRGLGLAQRLSYLNTTIYWFFSLTRLTFLLAPLSFIFFDLEIIDATFPEFVAFIVPHIFVALTLNNFLYGKLRLPFMSDIYETAQSLFLAPAVLAVIRNPRRPDWKVTPKNEVLTHDLLSQLVLPLAALFALVLGAEAFAAWRLVHEPYNVQHLSIVLVWNTLNLVIVTAALGAALEKGSAMQRLWMPVGTRAFARHDGATAPALIARSNGDHAEIVMRRGEIDRLVRGDRLSLAVEPGEAPIDRELDAVVVDTTRDRDGSSRYRVALEAPSLAAERAKVALLYGSSERWGGFQAGRRHRRSLLAGASIFAVIGLRQLGGILGVLVAAPGRGARRRQQRPAKAASAVAAAAVLVFLGALLWTTAADAQATPAAAEAAAPGAVTEAAPAVEPVADRPAPEPREARVVTLRSLTRDGELPTLDSEHPHASFDFVLPPTASVEDIELQLGWVNSPELRADPQGLELHLNGEVMGHLPVVPTGVQQDTRVALPTGAVNPGLNRLTIVSRYAQALICEGREVATWTTLSPGQSFLTVTTSGGDGEVSLADLDRAGWRWGIADRGVTLLTSRRPDDALLTTGANLAGALALRRAQAGLAVRHAVVAPSEATPADAPVRLRAEDLAPGINVLFGAADELREVLHPDVFARIDRPVVGVQQIAGAPESVVVVLTGRTAAEVHMAAMTLANADLVLPDAAWAELPQTPGTRQSPARSIAGDRTYRFDAAGVVRFDAAAQRLTLTMPAGFVATDNRKLELALDFAHAPGLPRGAVLEVLVNGAVVRQVRLEDPNGAFIEDRRVRLELASLRPGVNDIVFRAGIVGEDFDACRDAPRDWVEVFAGSEIALPRLVEVNRYPDLALLAAEDSPMGRFDGRDLGVVVADPTPPAVGAAWTFAARLADTRGFAMPQLEMRVAAATQRRHALWIGTAHLLDPHVAAAAGLAEVALGHAGAAQLEGPAPAAVTGRRSEWLSQLDQLERPGTIETLAREALQATGLEGVWDSVRLDLAASAQLARWRNDVNAFFRLDGTADRTALPLDQSFDAALAGLPRRSAGGELGVDLYLVAADGDTLERAVTELVRSEQWNRLEGSAAAWRVSGTTMATATPVLPLEAPAELSLAGVALMHANRLAADPGRWLLLVAGGALVIGTGIAVAMRREDDR